MITHNFICTWCEEEAERDFDTIAQYEKGKPHKCNCGGELDRTFSASAIRTTSSPNR